MISEEDIEAMKDCFETADKVCGRAKRGIPVDRWTIGEREMKQFVRAYLGMSSLCMELSVALEVMTDEIRKRGLESMDCGDADTTTFGGASS